MLLNNNEQKPEIREGKDEKKEEKKDLKDTGKLFLKPFRQTPGFCGPAVLKMLLSYFAKDFTEEQLAHLCNTTYIGGEDLRGQGTEHESMIEAIKSIDGYVFTKDHGTIAELEYFIKEEKLPVIVGWFDKDDDHYCVVVNVTDKNVILADSSKEGPERWIDRETFPNIWFDFVGKDDKIVSWGWYMVIMFEKRRFPKIQGGHYY